MILLFADLFITVSIAFFFNLLCEENLWFEGSELIYPWFTAVLQMISVN